MSKFEYLSVFLKIFTSDIEIKVKFALSWDFMIKNAFWKK